MPLSNLSSEIARLLEGRRPGLLAACVPEGALLDLETRIKVRLSKIEIRRARSIPLATSVFDSVQHPGENGFSKWFGEQFSDSNQKAMLFVGHATSDQQALATLIASRNFTNSNPEFSPCTVVVGAWNVAQVRAQWPAQGSPFEAHHIEFCEGLSLEAIQDLFDRKHPDRPLERNAYLDLIREETGGQEWLCKNLLEKLGTRHSQDIAVVLRDLHNSPSVVEAVNLRRNRLTKYQTDLLDLLLDRRCLHIVGKEHMVDAIELWLRGLATFRDAPHHAIAHGGSFHLSPPAPVIERCLRPDSRLILAVPAVSTALQPLLFQIENSLRDLVASVMTREFGPEWAQTELRRIKVLDARANNTSEEVEELVDARLIALGLIKENTVQEAEPTEVKVTLWDMIDKARTHLHESRADPTTGISDLCFLNLHDLTTILTSKHWFQRCFHPIFKMDSAALRAKLDDLRQARNAVAHHYPLKFSELERIRVIVEDLQNLITWKVS